jgi:hypothetical protein
MYMSLGLDKDHWSVLAPRQEDNLTLPSVEEIQAVWNYDKKEDESSSSSSSTVVPAEKTSLITLDNVEIRRCRDGITSQSIVRGGWGGEVLGKVLGDVLKETLRDVHGNVLGKVLGLVLGDALGEVLSSVLRGAQ